MCICGVETRQGNDCRNKTNAFAFDDDGGDIICYSKPVVPPTMPVKRSIHAYRIDSGKHQMYILSPPLWFVFARSLPLGSSFAPG